eukprot:CAMPEP_0203920978 /NCGR_PEP_ID=MMETSP0359-20131031/61195_1 /ASSEMBLY_ACC=CAM_ASM_000338 /TAXON_ID=268821 /ORGANISM="Scrippsiella Hangoei, Strain SHTV-5" /LENGTH=349 /DNA_ID=CAMNT_0050848577 /DNA_START=39 /DNA_END=1088 /DNA_ORIENTATION=-
MAAAVREISSQADLEALCGSHGGLSAVLLWAPWHPPSVHLNKVLEAIAGQEKSVRFGKINTDVCPDIATSLGADQVPFVAFMDPRARKIDGLAGADPPKLVEKVKALASRPFEAGASGSTAGGGGVGSAGQAGESDLNTRLRGLVNFSPVMLFMKGSKSEPFCGFSRKAIDMLNKHDIEYSTFDILQDQEVREGLKDYSNWKTFPQLYIGGELVGGLDIMKEMEEDGSLVEAIQSAAGGEEDAGDINTRLKGLINKADVMLFMKGNKEEPHCGFSKKAVAMLQEHKIEFDTFDILGDEDVRQGLKEYSNWKTFPQLYIKGELVGGLDIMQEMADDGSLQEAVPDTARKT